ncbi:MAG: B12-binding domain-containing radical SAM protein, partial [Candidatus Marinimicrobia bacterium]|nr:B12-binding domain-containing radical SAM protein [Candidatus Neomarinimicrobiota bacterium]
ELQLIDLTDRLRWNNSDPVTKLSSRGKYHKTIIPKPEAVTHIPRRFGLYGATKEQFLSALQNIDPPKAILLTSHMSYWYPGIVETVKILRKSFPAAKIILGGIYASLFPEHARRTVQPDYLITGYGEKQTLILMDAIHEIERDYSTIPEFDDSGILPWDLYPKINAATIMSSRGCPLHCDYCATPYLNPRFFQRAPEDIIAEIICLYEKFGIRQFAFYDDALFTNKKRHIIPILEGLLKHGVNARFHTPNGLFAKEIDPELAALMKLAGFQAIRVSLESIIPKWQKASTNKVSANHFEKALKNLENGGYKRSDIEAYLIMGLPGQCYLDIEKSIRYVAKLGVVSRLASYSPISHTTHWDQAKALGSVWDDMDPLLTNNTLYPCANREFPVKKFLKLRQLSNDLNKLVKKLPLKEDN